VESELLSGSRTQEPDWLLAPPGDQEADITAVHATGRVAHETYLDANFVIYRLANR
jgi:hypothetical protein